MKRLYTLLFLLLSVMIVMAQELAVKSFVLDLNDITASTQLRKDANGDACALIKVLLATPGATFHGNLRGDVSYDKGEYRVYLTEGTKYLYIKHEKFLPIKVTFADYDIKSLVGKRTYVLTLYLPKTEAVRENELNGHEYVDLGLGVKWATCNIGADSPEDFGFYFAWGEIAQKSSYDWSNCFDCKNSDKPQKDSSWEKINKKREDWQAWKDCAQRNWGGSWRMPYDKDFYELCTKCEWKWESLNGKYGYTITGPNGNSIFLPAAGLREGKLLLRDISADGHGGIFRYEMRDNDLSHNYGYYWTSVPSWKYTCRAREFWDNIYNVTDYSCNARMLYFTSGYQITWYCAPRYYGFPIRPVLGYSLE